MEEATQIEERKVGSVGHETAEPYADEVLFTDAPRLSANSADRVANQNSSHQDGIILQQMIHELPNSFAEDSGSKNEDEYDEEAQPSDGSQGVHMQIHGELLVENILEDTTFTPQLSSVHQVDQAVYSGDELAQHNKVDLARSAAGKTYEKALSQFAQLAESPFPVDDKPRRVSDQGGILNFSKNSNRQFQSDARKINTANYYGTSNCSDFPNAGQPVRAGSGLNLSDGAALHREKQSNLAQNLQTVNKTAISQQEGSQMSSGNQKSHCQKNLSESAAQVGAAHHQALARGPAAKQNNLFETAYYENQEFQSNLRPDSYKDQLYYPPAYYQRQSGSEGELIVSTPQGYMQARPGQMIRDFDPHLMDGRPVIYPQATQFSPDQFLKQQQFMSGSAHHGYVIPASEIHDKRPEQMRLQEAIHPSQLQDMTSSGARNFLSLEVQGAQSQDNNSSIFSGTPDARKLVESNVFLTPRQSVQFASESQNHSTLGVHDQFALSPPNLVFQSSRNQTPTPMAAASYRSPEVEHRYQRSQNKTSAGKSKATTAQINSSDLSAALAQHDQNSFITGASFQKFHPNSSIDSSHPALQTLSFSASPSPAKVNQVQPFRGVSNQHEQNQSMLMTSSPPGSAVYGSQPLDMFVTPNHSQSAQRIYHAQQTHGQPEMMQKHLFLQNQQQQVSAFPQFEYGSASQIYFKGPPTLDQSTLRQSQQKNSGPIQQFVGPQMMASENTSSTTSLQMQQLQPMFEGLQINSHNFRVTGGSEQKPLPAYQYAANHHPQHVQDLGVQGTESADFYKQYHNLPPKSNVHQFGAQQRMIMTGVNSKGQAATSNVPNIKSGSKSEANSHKSGYSGMIIKSIGGSGSQRTQTTAHTNTTDSISDDQLSSILISRLQKLPQSASWADKQEILAGKITQLATTQTGSRYLQNQLTKSNPVLIEFLLHEVGHKLSAIMVNQYGNYFFQKLLSNCSVDQRMRILQLIEGDFISICCHKQGTHTIQTIFDNVTMDHEENFIRNALQGHVCSLSVDPYGTHVIRKVLQCRSFNQERQSFIFEEIYSNLNQLCLNKNGLCVIKIVIALTKTPRQRQRVIGQISQDLIQLVSDPFGNYAVSQIVEKWEPKVCRPIFDKLSTKIFELSIQKYSSCVIEKCLEHGDNRTKSSFISEIRRSERLYALVSHNYGNFVIQKALKLSKGKEKEELMQAIEHSFPKIQDKKIRDKWQKILKDSASGGVLDERRLRTDSDVYSQSSPENQFDSAYIDQEYDTYDSQLQQKDFSIDPHKYMVINPQQPKYRTKQQRSLGIDAASALGSSQKDRQSRGSGGQVNRPVAAHNSNKFGAELDDDQSFNSSTDAMSVYDMNPSSGQGSEKPGKHGRNGRNQRRGQAAGRGSGAKTKQ